MAANIFIGPMSKNIVDSVIEIAETGVTLGLIPSRRQVEFNGGYVNNWKTEDFSKYVKDRTDNVILERDHGGPGQGKDFDLGYDSFAVDLKHFNMLHVDPWKQGKSFQECCELTAKYINFCYNLNSKIKFEVGTEEAIYSYSSDELDELLSFLFSFLKPEISKQIKYAVVQSGTSIKGTKNTGTYSSERLRGMVAVCKKHNLLSKEHNGDYLDDAGIKNRFENGLDGLNVAPEFGQIETCVILEEIKKLGDHASFDVFFNTVLESNKWRKWVPEKWDPYANKEELIKIAGHYVFSSFEVSALKTRLPNVDDKIKSAIKNKIYQMLRNV